MENVIILISHFIILFYIFYKNYFRLKLNTIEIVKKYKKLLIFLLMLPIIYLILNKITLKTNLKFFIFFNSYFIIVLISFLLFLILKRDKQLEFYDTSIYIYIYIYFICFVLNNNRSENGFVLFMFLMLTNLFFIFLQSFVEFSIIIYQQIIKKYFLKK